VGVAKPEDITSMFEALIPAMPGWNSVRTCMPVWTIGSRRPMPRGRQDAAVSMER
jgi:hypothetical protein